MDKKGNDAQIGSQKIKGEFNSAKECHAQCKKLRKEKAIRACEYSSKDKECVYHTYPISGGNGDQHFSCCVYNKSKPKTKRLDFLSLSYYFARNKAKDNFFNILHTSDTSRHTHHITSRILQK